MPQSDPVLNDAGISVVTGARGQWWRFTLATRLRCAIALLSLVIALLDGSVLIVLPWATAVIALEVFGERSRGPRGAKGVLYGLVGVVVLGLFFTLGDTVAVLPLLMVPAYRAGEKHGRAEAASIPLALGVGAALAAWGHRDEAILIAVVQWWALALGLAQLGAWGRRIEGDRLALTRARHARPVGCSGACRTWLGRCRVAWTCPPWRRCSSTR